MIKQKRIIGILICLCLSFLSACGDSKNKDDNNLLMLLGLTGGSSLNDGLVVYYSMNGNLNDSSGNGRNGTGTAGITYEDDHKGRALKACSFVAGEEITGPSATYLSNTMTVSCWFKSTSTSSVWFIFLPDQLSGFAYSGGTSEIGFFVTSDGHSDAAYASFLPDGTWRHVLGTYDGQDIKTYINGVLVKTSHNPMTATGVKNVNSILEIVDGTLTNMSIDEVRIYDRVLTDDEILALYHYSG